MFNGKLNIDIFLKKVSAHIICSKYFLIFTDHHESFSDITETRTETRICTSGKEAFISKVRSYFKKSP